MKRLILLLIFLGVPGLDAARAQIHLLVTEYATGNLRAYDFSGSGGLPLSVPPGWSPVGGVSTGADGMFLAADNRLYVNRDGGSIFLRSPDSQTFTSFASIGGSPSLLDLTADATHLYSASYGTRTIYQTLRTTATSVAIEGPAEAARFDGVRMGPDGRLYAVDSSNGSIFAYDPGLGTWSTFLNSPLAGDASQMEFSGNQVFLSRTISGQARIYRYSLNMPGDFLSGLNPVSGTLIGTLGMGTATGIRIGPDGRLYANNFNSGEIWRSNVGITAMEPSAFITGLSQPGSIIFATIPEPALPSLLAAGLILLVMRRQWNAVRFPARRPVGSDSSTEGESLRTCEKIRTARA